MTIVNRMMMKEEKRFLEETGVEAIKILEQQVEVDHKIDNIIDEINKKNELIV